MYRQYLIFWLLVGLVLHSEAKTYLVCVGIADYPGTKNDLRISDTDAWTISQIFLSTKDTECKVLTNSNATHATVLSSMRTIFSQAGEFDTVILFFSGHGTPGALVCYDKMLPYSNILSVLKKCKAKKKIILVDACFSGKMRVNQQQHSRYSNQEVMFFLSSRTNETALETGYRNSMFTIYLERGLRGGADVNRDRSVSARELYDFVHQGVIEASRDRQHPVMWGKFDNEMTVIKW